MFIMPPSKACKMCPDLGQTKREDEVVPPLTGRQCGVVGLLSASTVILPCSASLVREEQGAVPAELRKWLRDRASFSRLRRLSNALHGDSRGSHGHA